MSFGTSTTPRSTTLSLALAAVSWPTIASPGQQPGAPAAYPERDILSPFRACSEISAPPEEQFRQLRIMMDSAKRAPARSFDAEGRSVIDDERWRLAREQLDLLGLDAGHLAQLMRSSRDAEHRAVAFHGAFYCLSPNNVFNLISHIPGEPVRPIREAAYPRAIAFLKAHLGRTYGDLTPEQQNELDLPEPGSPAARQSGITRAPIDSDPLYVINLKPFFQLLDLDEALDQAQGLWFLAECFRMRPDLAQGWLEPALPRVNELLINGDRRARAQAIGLLQAIGPENLEVPAIDADNDTLSEFASRAAREMFPPIRRLGAGLLLLLPGSERDALVVAGKKALNEGLGSPTYGKTRGGLPYRGFRIERVPDHLAVLGLPVGAVITAVNGVPVRNGEHLIEVIAKQFYRRDGDGEMQPISTRRLMVEYVIDRSAHAIEYRVL